MTNTLPPPEAPDDAALLREIRAALHDLKFGSVEITLHHGQVVQIERKEKFRLQPTGKQA
ncbi:sulfur starvation response protein OscA [Stutzerimonas stutzeri]|uniref:sulfur starvation response protein OscA n=1 Tax=Stutzerimonas stutzeri TaxID=316 RepID=UPI001C2EA420|nr:sulfur starvation response protein OscA [Stutzerimonas stutzeri]